MSLRDRRYLLCYDIRDPKRLSRIYRRVGKCGWHLQYSVFYIEAPVRSMEALVAELSALIEDEDDVRIYEISKLDESGFLGLAMAPDGVVLC